MKFKLVRCTALQYWQASTGRICSAQGDDISESYECNWQNSYKKSHINVFCSFGIWSSCLSQLLLDERYDEIDITDRKENEVIYLFYNQVLLVVGEVLNDLEQIYRQATKLGSSMARKKLSGNAKYTVGKVVGFINNVVKHKAENGQNGSFHACNHHLPIRFEDDGKSRQRNTTISVNDISNLISKKSILMPSLLKLIELIDACYSTIDALFDENPDVFINYVEKY